MKGASHTAVALLSLTGGMVYEHRLEAKHEIEHPFIARQVSPAALMNLRARRVVEQNGLECLEKGEYQRILENAIACRAANP